MLLKIKKSTQAGLALVLLGVAFGIHANLSTYIDAQGFLHESFSTPLSVVLVLLGVITTVVGLFFRKK